MRTNTQSQVQTSTGNQSRTVWDPSESTLLSLQVRGSEVNKQKPLRDKITEQIEHFFHGGDSEGGMRGMQQSLNSAT